MRACAYLAAGAAVVAAAWVAVFFTAIELLDGRTEISF